MLVWTFASTCLLVASTLATLFTTLHLRWRWDVCASSVRWLFWFFFLWVFLWSLVRLVFYAYMLSLPEVALVDDGGGRVYTSGQLDRLGLYGLMQVDGSKRPWVTAMLVAGDEALCGIALTLFPLIYELGRLARKSMDRGATREREMIHRYCTGIAVGMLVYAAAQITVVTTYGGYDIHAMRCALVVYIIQFCGMAFMAGLLYTLKINGRKYETIHGTFVESPVYQRLKNIMLVYSTFSFVFQVAFVIINAYDTLPDGRLVDFVAFSLLFYNASGLALSITTSCSQACVFSTCRHCLPEDFEAQFLCHQRFITPEEQEMKAPEVNPVFVFTDIESSTALWNVNSTAMAAATEIHDNILRTTLLKHRGYEITTVGDAFQMAFHTIQDAIEYCMDVQLQLLVAPWPKEIDGAVPATKKEREKGRVIFNGLRVRMGIHDATDADGVLVQGIHVVTGKATYSGVSEIIAEYVGDLGSGGQILITDRVAAWLRHHRTSVSVDVFMDYVGSYVVPQINASVEIYQLQPLLLATRASRFEKPPITLPTLFRERTTGKFQIARGFSMYRVNATLLSDHGSWPELPNTTLSGRPVGEEPIHLQLIHASSFRSVHSSVVSSVSDVVDL